jgi:hypothetical protein
LWPRYVCFMSSADEQEVGRTDHPISGSSCHALRVRRPNSTVVTWFLHHDNEPTQPNTRRRRGAMRMGPPYRSAFTVQDAICTWRHSRFPSAPRRRETKGIALVCISGIRVTIPLLYGALEYSWASEVACSLSEPKLQFKYIFPSNTAKLYKRWFDCIIFYYDGDMFRHTAIFRSTYKTP